MPLIDVLIVGAFGLWLALAPASVMRFYAWFHRGLPDPQPKIIGIRFVGVGVVVMAGILLCLGRF
jgi:hypothetical protein